MNAARHSNDRQIVFRGDLLASQDVLKVIKSTSVATLSVPSQYVLHRSVELPLAAARRAREAVHFMLGKLSPFPPDEVYYSTQAGDAERSRKVVRVNVAVLPRRIVDVWTQRLVASGVYLTSIVSEPEADYPAFEFADARYLASQPASFRRDPWKVAIAVSAALIFLGPAAIAAWTHVRASHLASEASELEKETKEALTLRQRLKSYEDQSRIFSTRSASSSAARILEALADRIPDNAWLFAVELDRGDATIHGFSPNVPELLKGLASPPFASSQLIGSIVNGQAEGKDRFEMSVKTQAPQS